jgi:hypothetical protein
MNTEIPIGISVFSWIPISVFLETLFVTVLFNQFERETNDFHPYFDDISAICWSILMQDSEL